MTILEAHWRFDLEFNKLNSNNYRAFLPPEKDELFNTAQLLLLAEKTRWENGQGFEFDSKNAKELANLTVHQEPIIPINKEVKSSMFAFKPYQLVRYIADISQGGCTKTIEESRFRKHDLLTLATQKANFKWGLVNAYYGRSTSNTDNDEYAIFLDNKDFTVDKIYITYIKYPNKVCLGGYDDINGDPLTAVEFEWAEEAIRQIISLAVGIAMNSLQSKQIEDEKYN